MIDVFPNGPGDTRHTTRTYFEGSPVEAHDHLCFYARFCALRDGSPIAPFFERFTADWIATIIGVAATAARPDLRSLPFLLDILLKCIGIDPALLAHRAVGEILNIIQRAIVDLHGDDPQTQRVRRLVNLHLSCFYRDIAGFPNKAQLIDFMLAHVTFLKDVRDSALIADFLRGALSPTVLVLLCAPLSSGSVFARDILVCLQPALSDLPRAESLLAMLVGVLQQLGGPAVSELIDGLAPFLEIYGWEIPAIRGAIAATPEDRASLAVPFVFALTLFARTDLQTISPLKIALVRLILEVSDAQRLSDDTKDWSRIAWAAQSVAIRLIEIGATFDWFSSLVVPTFRAPVSSSFVGKLVAATRGFLDRYSAELYQNRRAVTYKLWKVVVANLTKDLVPLLADLWAIDARRHKTNTRSLAFFLRALYRRARRRGQLLSLDPDGAFLACVDGTPFAEPARAFAALWDADFRESALDSESRADRLLALADFFTPAPDIRIRFLLQLADVHAKGGWDAEAAMAFLRAAALIAEVLAAAGSLPVPLSAASFLECCPSAGDEAAFSARARAVFAQTPRLPGFCSPKYFCEIALFTMVDQAVAACKPGKGAPLLELASLALSPLRELAEARGLWAKLATDFRAAGGILEKSAGVESRAFPKYFLVELESGELFVYRESPFARLEDLIQKVTRLCEKVSGGRAVKVQYEGGRLDRQKLDKAYFWILVKLMEPYISPEESRTRVTDFECNFRLTQFGFYLAPEYRGSETAANCWMTRVVVTVPQAMPYITSRIRVSPDAISSRVLSPPAIGNRDLRDQIAKLKAAIAVRSETAIPMLTQGHLIGGVNAGALSTAETFLAGGRDGEEYTEMRRLFTEFIDLLEWALRVQGELAEKNPRIQKLHSETCAVMPRMRARLQPFLV